MTEATKSREHETRAGPEDAPARRTRRGIAAIPWIRVAVAAVPVGIGVYYLCWAAPARVPVPETVDVPYPEFTRWLEPICVWCGQHPLEVVGIGAGLLLAGAVLPFLSLFRAAERYYLCLTIVASVALIAIYLSISAPIDRLLNAVEDSLPKDNRLPSWNDR